MHLELATIKAVAELSPRSRHSSRISGALVCPNPRDRY